MGLKDLVKELKGGEDLLPELTLFLLNEGKLPSFREDGWHPSEICSMCPREVVLRKAMPSAVPVKTTDASMMRYFNFGHWVHAGYQEEYLGPMGVLWGSWECSRCHKVVRGFMPRQAHQCSPRKDSLVKDCSPCGLPEVEGKPEQFEHLSPMLQDNRGGCLHCGRWGFWRYKEERIYDEETGIVGKTDAILKVGSLWWIGEIKTINPRAFPQLVAAYQEHKAQAVVYWWNIREKARKGLMPFGPDELAGVKFVYVNKSPGMNDRHEKEFDFRPDKDGGLETLEEVLRNVRTAKHGLEHLQLPAGVCKSSDDKRAKGCWAVEPCFSGKDYQEIAQ